MSKAVKIFAGVGIATAAAIWYFLLRGKAQCTNGDSKCIGDDLYTCINGIWQLTEENSPLCVGPGDYVCPYCPATFSTYEELVAHVQTVHPGERIPIDIDWT